MGSSSCSAFLAGDDVVVRFGFPDSAVGDCISEDFESVGFGVSVPPLDLGGSAFCPSLILVGVAIGAVFSGGNLGELCLPTHREPGMFLPTTCSGGLVSFLGVS